MGPPETPQRVEQRVSDHRPFPAGAAFAGERLTAIGGVAVEDLADRFGTPLWVLDRAELVGRMRAYREAFGDAAVVYAAKALCVTGVLQLAAAEGLEVDVASGGELHTAVRAGVPMERVVFHGNNKSVDELADAARLGVGRVVADSFDELARLEAVGRAADHRFQVLLRVTPGVHAETHDFIRTGHDDSKFGFSLAAGLAAAAVDAAVAADHLDLVGLHCHLGSQIVATDVYDAAATLLFDLVAEVRDRHGLVLPEVDLGGGLGIAYTRGDVAPAIGDYAAAVRAAVAREAARVGVPVPRLLVEPGRSLVGPAGVTLYRVGTVKEIPGVRTYVSVDGGMSDNLRPALYGAVYDVAPAGADAGAADPADDRLADSPPPPSTPKTVTVVGKHCESGDVLARDVMLPTGLAVGDLVAIAATGAYSHAMASNYNRLPRPAMVLVGDGRADLLVRRETLDDVVGLDVALDLAEADRAGG